MLSFQALMTDKDRNEAASIEKRRARDEERRKRIFNPRARLIGIDVDVLKCQVEEKKKRDQEERKIERLFDEEMRKAEQIAIALEQTEKMERKKLLQEIDEYRKHFQRPEDRREYDLNDPNIIKKQLPVRIDDNDPRLGPSSAQKFEGEDLVNEQRLKVQREQIKAWLNQQMLEKDQAEKERKVAEEAYKAAVVARDERAVELDNMEKECRKRLKEACVRYNKALANEKLEKYTKLDQQTSLDNRAEIYNALMSDMLTENPDVAQSNMGPGKKIGYLYKGMTEEEVREVRKYQRQQIEEMQQRKNLEERMNREFDDYINGIQKSICMMDKELEVKRRARLQELAEENKRMAKEHENQKQYLEKIVYVNRASDEFFDQFNRSTR